MSSNKNVTPGAKPKTKTSQKIKEGKSEKPFDNILSNDKKLFCEWFWKGSHSNALVTAVNEHPNEHGILIRKEKAIHSPQIYCVVLNYNFFEDVTGQEWKFCKVGITLVHNGVYDRVEQVQVKIKNKNKDYTDMNCLFRLPISATDTTNIYDTEYRIRKDMGFLVDKNLAKKLDLPVSTEWALASTIFISAVEREVEKAHSTAIFNSRGKLKTSSILALKKTPPRKINYKKKEIITISTLKEDADKDYVGIYKINDQPTEE